MIYAYILSSPVGPLRLVADERALHEVTFSAEEPTPEAVAPPTLLLAQAVAQIREYLAGQRYQFELPLAPVGTPFQQRVWAELRRIPFGQTITYATLARRVGDALAVRAVGRANGANPLAIVQPCHRVVGTGGKLTGFAGGLDRKEWLLRHEGRLAGQGELF